MTNHAIWAGEQERQKVKKRKQGRKNRHGGDNFTCTGTRLRWTKFRQCNYLFQKFYRNQLRGFGAVRGQKWGSSIDFDRRPYSTVLPVIRTIGRLRARLLSGQSTWLSDCCRHRRIIFAIIRITDGSTFDCFQTAWGPTCQRCYMRLSLSCQFAWISCQRCWISAIAYLAAVFCGGGVTTGCL